MTTNPNNEEEVQENWICDKCGWDEGELVKSSFDEIGFYIKIKCDLCGNEGKVYINE